MAVDLVCPARAPVWHRHERATTFHFLCLAPELLSPSNGAEGMPKTLDMWAARRATM